MDEPSPVSESSGRVTTVVRSLLPPFVITVTLPDGRVESISEPMSTEEYRARWGPDFMLATNDPAGTLRSGWNRTRELDEHGVKSKWEHHEVEVTIWCDRLPDDGPVTVSVQFADDAAHEVTLDGAAIRRAARDSENT